MELRVRFLFNGGGTFEFETSKVTAYNIETALINGNDSPFIVIHDEQKGNTLTIRRSTIDLLTIEKI